MPVLKDLNFAEGKLLLVDKPLEWSSFDVVKKIRNAIKIKKVGHAGTLDPLATGLLIVATGKSTKKIESVQAQAKEYTGTIKFGSTTPSYDLETEPENHKATDSLNKEAIEQTIQQFIGVIEQIPPMHSAVKVNGKRAYSEARKGKEVKLKARQVTVSAFEVTKFNLPEITFRLACSKGTYVRSIAHDLGQELGVGAHLTSLRRTKIGDYSVEEAWNLHALISEVNLLKENENL